MANTPMTTRESSTSSSLSDVDIDASTTPPTSQADTGEMSISSAKKPAALLDAIEESVERRPRRSRAGGPSSYNLKQLSDAQLPISSSASRNVSGLTGRTLVDGGENDEVEVEDLKKMGMGKGEEEEEEAELPPRPLQRKTSVKDRVKKAAGRVVGSVLGKRGRDVVEAGKRKLGRGKSRSTADDEDENEDEASDTEPQAEVPRWKKALEMGPKGLLDELDLDVDLPAPPPAKKARLSGKEAMKDSPQPSAPLAKAATATTSMKPWIREGLYVGQSPDFDATQPGGKRKLTKKRPGSSSSSTLTTTTTPGAAESSGSKRTFLPLPMFGYLKEEKTRDFRIPYDVFAPSLRKGDERPKDWHQVNRNRLVGEAKQIWEKSERLPASRCVCRATEVDGEQACGDHCLNRVMQYECNDDNCAVKGGECGNRCFADLTARLKKGGAFDVGVEVLRTPNRGFGVRSCRTWGPGEIIMEYTGEIVSEGECQRRMREDYKDKQCYYLMELERGLIIDGTKGSMARFINHSCEPNCEVRMVKVNGTPRMGVFAGEGGVATGQELTYDYNFDNFGEKVQMCYCGAASCRGTLSKRLNKDEQKKQLKVENEKKRKAAEEAQKAAEDEERKKRVKSDRGSGWRGWASVDDPEVKARLKEEKREREAAAKSSDRARRLAARGSGVVGARIMSLPAAATEKGTGGKRDVKRRRTVAVEETVTRSTQLGEGDEGDEVDAEAGAEAGAEAVVPAAASSRPVSATVTTRKTEITISETAEPEPVADRLVTALDGVHDDEEEEEEEEEVVVVAPAKTKKQSIMKSVGQAVRNGLFGAVGAKALGGGGGKGVLKQSTLSFGKRSG
ncbi:hypothetical protein LTR56_009335 [Elasticomyces elasticus]|nr:hypothetical protein LTR56_009335 [Elasticomyces elasticus]KAK3666351.1 hypothetical protein LTR22_002655 [Elasticomyces elasticus]KAK4917730.1 hypothetical protein LTR49_014407 [Elasticomyces elasticus]KAK5766291.1 hypothetical protein LTS12_003502 [Elasticomyces elasticus]